MTAGNRLQLISKFGNGQRGKGRLLVASTLVDPESALLKGVGSLRALLETATGSATASIEITNEDDVAGASVGGDYTSRDKMRLTFTDAQGKAHAIVIPAPLPGKFQSDKRTVNLADSDVASFVDWYIVNGCTPQGVSLVSCDRGIRTGFNKRQRSP